MSTLIWTLGLVGIVIASALFGMALGNIFPYNHPMEIHAEQKEISTNQFPAFTQPTDSAVKSVPILKITGNNSTKQANNLQLESSAVNNNTHQLPTTKPIDSTAQNSLIDKGSIENKTAKQVSESPLEFSSSSSTTETGSGSQIGFNFSSFTSSTR